MNAYQYVVLRLVPRVDREEFINVGVVLYCQDAGFLDAAWDLDERRAAALCTDVRPRRCALGARTGARRVPRRDGARAADPRQARPAIRLDHRARARRGAARPVHGGLTDDPAVELARLLDRLVPRLTSPTVSAHRGAQGPHRDGRGRGDVERVDAPGHRDAHGEVGRRHGAGREAVALGADDEGEPLRRDRLELVERHRVVGRGPSRRR